MSFEAELPETIFKKNYFSITDRCIVYIDTEMMCEDIKAFSYGAVKHSVNGVHNRTDYNFNFVDSSDDVIRFRFSESALLGWNSESLYNSIVHFSWHYFGNRIIDETINAIRRGETVTIAGFELNQQGVHFTKKRIFGKDKPCTIAWRVLGCEAEDGNLGIYSRVDRDISRSVSIQFSLNSFILLHIARLTMKDREFYKTLMG